MRFWPDLSVDFHAFLDGFQGLPSRMRREIALIQSQLADLPGTNYQQALRLQEKSKPAEALLRLRFALRLRPNFPEALYEMGRLLIIMGNDAEAMQCFRKALALRPGWEEAAYFLALLDPNAPPPATMPERVARDHFDTIASRYEQGYVEALDYRAPLQLYEMLAPVLPASPVLSILDMGCGTGGCGTVVRSAAHYLRGVDISRHMLERASAKRSTQGEKLYDSLILMELNAFLPMEKDASFDLILAGGVWNYVGDWARLMPDLKRLLKPGGALAFTVEKSTTAPQEWFREVGRFRHSRFYVEQVAATHALVLETCDDILLYRDAPGYRCLLRKPE
jgi:predicted TPR repeat methyltransferase